jgi:hypothetical protein
MTKVCSRVLLKRAPVPSHPTWKTCHPERLSGHTYPEHGLFWAVFFFVVPRFQVEMRISGPPTPFRVATATQLDREWGKSPAKTQAWPRTSVKFNAVTTENSVNEALIIPLKKVNICRELAAPIPVIDLTMTAKAMNPTGRHGYSPATETPHAGRPLPPHRAWSVLMCQGAEKPPREAL